MMLPGCKASGPKAGEKRMSKEDAELRYWLGNMERHGYSAGEMAAATGLSEEEIEQAVARLSPAAPTRGAGDPLIVLPYPGGRHPRIGFLDGAVNPQRGTKISVFTPWDASSYVVVDVPEAIWSNLGLTYLAHTHIATVWDQKGITLENIDWTRRADGTLAFERRLPNGITFGTKVRPERDVVRMEMWLTNGTNETLTDLRTQVCVMFKGAAAFNGQTNDNKVLTNPYVACRSEDGKRWVMTAWEPCHRPWANPPCPCMHSDPVFADCPPGETRRARGILWFYEGTDVEGEFERMEATGWGKDGGIAGRRDGVFVKGAGVG